MSNSKTTITSTVQVSNELGLHTRPATLIVKLLQEFKSEVTFSYKNERVDARSILNILMLAAPKNALITISVSGIDAEKTMDHLVECFASRFGEDGENV